MQQISAIMAGLVNERIWASGIRKLRKDYEELIQRQIKISNEFVRRHLNF